MSRAYTHLFLANGDSIGPMHLEGRKKPVLARFEDGMPVEIYGSFINDESVKHFEEALKSGLGALKWPDGTTEKR